MVVSQDGHVASLAAAPHSHGACHGLHGVVAASSLCLCLCFHFRTNLLALSSSLSSQFSRNETTS